jgi:hypothetical protein
LPIACTATSSPLTGSQRHICYTRCKLSRSGMCSQRRQMRRGRSCGLRTMTRRPWPLVRDLGAYRRPSRQRWTRRLRGLRLSMWWWQQTRWQQPSTTPPDGDTIGIVCLCACARASIGQSARSTAQLASLSACALCLANMPSGRTLVWSVLAARDVAAAPMG